MMSPAEFMQRTVVRGPRIVLPSTWFSPFNDRFAALNRATCRTAVGETGQRLRLPVSNPLGLGTCLALDMNLYGGSTWMRAIGSED